RLEMRPRQTRTTIRVVGEYRLPARPQPQTTVQAKAIRPGEPQPNSKPEARPVSPPTATAARPVTPGERPSVERDLKRPDGEKTVNWTEVSPAMSRWLKQP